MKNIIIVYGVNDTPLIKRAIEFLNRTLLDYTFQYPMCVKFDDKFDYSKYRCIYIGTKENNVYISRNTQASLTDAESYCISVKDDTVIIEGFDDAGVLYGCIDFYNKYIVKHEYNTPQYHKNIFLETLPDFSLTSAPSVKFRGLWTWGHVIYDYKKYIDNMMLLKMNTVIIWNDFVPVNAKEMIDYAHNCGIKVIWGYAWGWDTDCSIQLRNHLLSQSHDILNKFKEEYAKLNVDGIYFQSATEMQVDEVDGVCVADVVTEFVNVTAELFFNEFPKLELQFGLHATSVKNRLEFIKRVDSRIYIIWEACGAFPFSYYPSQIKTFEETKEFTKRISTLRGNNDKFGVVTKGFTKLDWSEFLHMEGPIFIGKGSDSWKENRIVRKSKIWKYLQAYWLVNSDKALEMVKTMADIKQGDLYVTALVEDGMFEENIMYPVALFSEMLWDCNTDIKELMSKVALREYITFA